MGKRAWITVTMPQASWDLFEETLEMDAESSAFDRELRDRIRAALEDVVVLKREER